MKRQHSKLRKILVAMAITLSVCAFASLLGLYVFAQSISSIGDWLAYDSGCLEWWGGPDDPAAVEEGANLILPPSTKNLSARSVAFQDCIVFVNFDMAPDDLDSFLASTDVSKLDSIAGSGLGEFTNLIQNDVNWTFDDDRVYLYGKGGDSNRSWQYIVIDQTTTGGYKVYVIHFLP